MGSEGKETCIGGLDNVAEFKISLTDELPVVGFHALTDIDEGIVKLGLIMVNSITPDCLMNMPNVDPNNFESVGEFSRAELAENSITKEETRRAQLVEAVLRYDQMKNTKITKEELSKKVKMLIESSDFSIDQIGQDDFRTVMNRLKEYHGEGSDYDIDQELFEEM